MVTATVARTPRMAISMTTSTSEKARLKADKLTRGRHELKFDDARFI
jgi:hypothetical protein